MNACAIHLENNRVKAVERFATMAEARAYANGRNRDLADANGMSLRAYGQAGRPVWGIIKGHEVREGWRYAIGERGGWAAFP
jgi:hypothetical protein